MDKPVSKSERGEMPEIKNFLSDLTMFSSLI